MSSHNQHIRKARRDYLSAKRGQLKQSTIRCYKRVTEDFVEYAESDGIEGTSDLDGFIVQQWKLKRREHDDVAPVTLQNDVRHLRVFIKWLEASELVQHGLYEKIEVPEARDDQVRSDETLSPTRAEAILSHLELYEYATRLHAVTKLLWHTGCRIGAAVALDLRDYDPAEKRLMFRDRREAGTPLKNGPKSERNITLDNDTIGVLNDYIHGRRDGVTDKHDREPLFTTPHGRMQRQRAYKDLIGVSRPCVYSNECPHDRDIEECDAAQRKTDAYGCPSTRSSHPIRRGSITYHLNSGVDKQKVSGRCDVSVRVLEKHYDTRTHEDKREGRKGITDRL